MRARFVLPPTSKRNDVGHVLRYQLDSSQYTLDRYRWEWTRTDWFLQGVRTERAGTWGASGGTPDPHRIDRTQQRRVRVELALAMYQVEMGRILSMDLGPSVVRTPGVNLDVVRRDAITQTALDNFWDRYNKTPFLTAHAHYLTAYGTCGVGAFECPTEYGGVFGASALVVPPWELKPLPGTVSDISQVEGLCWERWVSLNWLKSNFKGILSFPRGDDADKMRIQEAPSGSSIQTQAAPQHAYGLGALTLGYYPGGNSRIGSPAANQGMQGEVPIEPYVLMRECWLHTEDYGCHRWIVMLGEHVALDIDFQDHKLREEYGFSNSPEMPSAPLHVSRHTPVSGFWGRGLIDRQIHLNRELELVAGDLIQEGRDVKRFRKLLLPQDSGINIRALDSYLDKTVLMYAPNPISPTIKPDVLEVPSVARELGATAQFLQGLMQATAIQSPVLQGQGGGFGRVDTSGGVAQIIQQQAVPMLPIAESVEGAMKGFWKSVHGILRKNLKKESALDLLRLDESAIGLRVDGRTGKVQLDSDNVLPHESKVNINIRSKFPTNKEVKKAQLDELLQKKLISDVQYRMASFREGLDLPLINRAEWENYQSAWYENIVMFGDGETPGEAPQTLPEYENHPIHLAVIGEFMSRMQFRQASAAVQMAFKEHLDYHKEMVGFPADLTSVDMLGNLGPPGALGQQLAAMGARPPGGGTPLKQSPPPAVLNSAPVPS